MCLSGRQVESEGGIWFKIGDTIKFIAKLEVYDLYRLHLCHAYTVAREVR
jgi:hypothetical protein